MDSFTDNWTASWENPQLSKNNFYYDSRINIATVAALKVLFSNV